ncbi:MAG: TlpA disulfide reductase family protein [Polyangiales bacterium]
MRRAITGFLVVILVALAVTPALALDRGGRAPDIDLPGVQGGRVRLAEHAGKVVVVDFWASWCKPCSEEIPHLDRLYQKYKSKGFAVIGVSVDRERAKAKEFISRLKATFPSGHDAEHVVADRYAPSKMPSSYVVDRGGVVRFTHFGFRAGEERAIESEVQSLLAK